jgi:hypothetical protein
MNYFIVEICSGSKKAGAKKISMLFHKGFHPIVLEQQLLLRAHPNLSKRLLSSFALLF